MIVKRSIVENWYRKDSWVYKNFAFLYSNPLWDKYIPGGFSVCPYFWLSLFSLFIFRPFIYCPIQYVAKPILMATGKVGGSIDAAGSKIAEGIFNIKSDNTGTSGVFPKGFGILLWFCFFVLLWIGRICWGPLSTIYTLGMEEPSIRWLFYWVRVFICLSIGLVLYKRISKSNCNISPFFNFLGLVFIGSTVCMFPAIVLDSILKVGILIGTGVWALAILAWGILSGIWSGILAVVLWAPFGLPSGFLLGMIIVSGLLIGAGISAIEYFVARQLQTLKTNDPDRFKNNCRKHWNRLIMTAFGEDFKDRLTDQFYFGDDVLKYEAVRHFKSTLVERAIYLYWGKDFKRWETISPDESNIDWKEAGNRTLTDSYRLYALFTDLKTTARAFEYFKFKQVILNVIESPEMNAKIEAHKTYIRNMPVDPRRFDTVKGDCANLADFIESILGKAWTMVSQGYNGIVTFFAYIWMLIKAKKQGACPFFRFKDVEIESK